MAKAGLSLYANLVDPSSSNAHNSTTIAKAPVVFKQPAGEESHQDEGATQKQQLNAASLRFQPTKRPQITSQKQKPKAFVSKSSAPATTTIPPTITSSDQRPNRGPSTVKSSLADWAATGDDEDVNGFYGGEKRQRGGRKKRKKNKEESHVFQNWDDIYDPARPNSYEEYKNSDEKILEVREWKERLYAHRRGRENLSELDSDEDSRPVFKMSGQFAPPPMSFAPPHIEHHRPAAYNDDLNPTINNDSSGEDAFTRRLQMSQNYNQTSESPDLPLPPGPSPSTHLPLAVPTELSTKVNLRPVSPIRTQQPAPSISRAPVRYNLPLAPSEIPASEAELERALQQDTVEIEREDMDDAPRSRRPGQKGFAERLMSKYGWSKGSGLGANQSGIVNPLRVQVEKQKKKPDSEGGGFVGPGGMGKIIGGRKKEGVNGGGETGRFGAMSEVIILRGMVDGMDLDAELEGGSGGGLMQEIGEECGEKYGRVERVFLDRGDPASAKVFVKFTSQLSALRAVNALEGRIFNGNTISAKFFDAESFEKGSYV